MDSFTADTLPSHRSGVSPELRANRSSRPAEPLDYDPLQELVLLCPSPRRRSKRRAATEEGLNPALAAATPRRKGKTRAVSAAAAAGLMGCASPKKVRRARRRLEKEIIGEERDSVPFEDDAGRARKRRKSRPKVAQKEKISFGSPVPSSCPMPSLGGQEITGCIGCSSVDGLRELILELLMWKNTPKSTLWFGAGSIFFLSSSISREFSFSIISTVSHLGIFVLAVSFFSDSFPRRQQLKWRGDFQLTEEGILRAARVILPMANAVLAKTQDIFSGKPSMTLKVAPILLFTAKYGHLITIWRLFSIGFFLSFTAPKLYSTYCQQIHERGENMRKYVCGAWKSCQHKRFVAASAATIFWNLFSVKARIFAAFISVVMLRHHHQQHIGEEEGQRDSMEEEQQLAMVATAERSSQ